MSWQPSASLDTLKARSQLNAYIREFFVQRDVMEVETPVMSMANVSDANLKAVVAQCGFANVTRVSNETVAGGWFGRYLSNMQNLS